MEPSALMAILQVVSGTSPPPDPTTAIANGISWFTAEVNLILSMVDTATLEITAAAIVTMFIVGFLLFFSHVNKRIGKSFIEGAIILLAFITFAAPYILHI